MVHRIQNRNPGYSDFSSSESAQSFNFSPTMSSPITHGANALKLENEVIEEQILDSSTSQMTNEQITTNQEIKTEIDNVVENDYEKSFSEEAINDVNKIDEVSSVQTEEFSNGLENFGVEEDSAPDLFNSENDISENQDLLSSESNDDDSETDDLEIPAFLRRQKN